MSFPLAATAVATTLAALVLWLRLRGRRGVIAVVLGSGGHTNEMFRMLLTAKLPAGRDMVFVVGKGDLLSEEKLQTWQSKSMVPSRLYRVTRPRQVHQPLWASLPHGLKSLLECMWVVVREPPDIVLTNGPALGVVVSLAARVCAVSTRRPRIVYVESFARVYSLSASGRAMQYVAHRFLVQWPELAAPRGWLAAPRTYGTGPLV